MTTTGYQIRFIWKEGGRFSSAHYEYFEVTGDDKYKKAAEVANKYLDKRRENSQFVSIFRTPFKPVKVAEVREWDKDKKKPAFKGDRFKLRLSYMEFRFKDGSKKRDEWYEAETIH